MPSDNEITPARHLIDRMNRGARWPVLCCCPSATADMVTKFTLLAFLEERVPRWWVLEDIVFTDHIPKTSVGEFSKREFR